MKKAIAAAGATAAAAFLIRVLFNIISIDPYTGFGTAASRISIYVLLIVAAIEFAVFPAKRFIQRLHPERRIRSAGSVGKTVVGGLAGLFTAVASVFGVIEVISEGNLVYFFSSRAEILEAGILDASFQWRFIAALLGIPSGIWLILVARREYRPGATIPGGRFSAALPVVYIILRVLARYTHDGANPHNESAAVCIASTTLTCILLARFATFVSSGCSVTSSLYLCKYAIPALICCAASLPAVIPMITAGEFAHAGYTVSDLLFSVFCLITAAGLRTERKLHSEAEHNA